AEEDAPRAWLGASTSVDDGRLVVTRVPRDTPAAAAGLSPDDEILAIGGYRVPPRDLDGRLGMFEAGQESTLLVSRRERLLELPVTFGEKPDESWKLEVDPDATEEQEAHREAWLGTPGD
ncbi:MAG TPA: PDZ domain-containing protein, partial [Thermoanaerobaculia bacterium]